MELPVATARDPRWLDLADGASVLARPVGTAIVYAARARADHLIATLKEAGAAVTRAGGTVTGVPDIEGEADEKGVWDMLFALSLAELTVEDWKGVTRGRQPVPFKPDLLAAFMADVRIADLFIARQMAKQNEAASEGNA